MANRKLVRPNLAEIKEKYSGRPQGRERDNTGTRRRPAPPDQTSAEAFYYLKQMNNHTPMVVVLDDGEQLRGKIEWYDRTCIKLHQENGTNFLVFKHSIKYLFKQEEEETSH